MYKSNKMKKIFFIILITIGVNSFAQDSVIKRDGSELKVKITEITDTQLKYQKENGVRKKLVAFKLLERGIPRKDYIIEDENNSEIGIVTSGTMGPSVKFSIGLGYVKTQFAALGTKIFVRIRQKPLQAEIVKLPFYKL